MKTIHCDFCGEEIEYPQENNHKISCEWHGMHGFNEENYDSCYKCFDKIFKVIDKNLLRTKK
jgi:hypothetical protein